MASPYDRVVTAQENAATRTASLFGNSDVNVILFVVGADTRPQRGSGDIYASAVGYAQERAMRRAAVWLQGRAALGQLNLTVPSNVIAFSIRTSNRSIADIITSLPSSEDLPLKVQALFASAEASS